MTSLRSLHERGDCMACDCRHCEADAEARYWAHMDGEHWSQPNRDCRLCEDNFQ